ncbi:hypothetical protein ACLOJK_017244 [Asimina triloba]
MGFCSFLPYLNRSGMGSRVPVQHYNLRSANSFIGSSLHDLNTVDTRPGEIEGISDVDRDGVTEGSLENDEESNSVDCIHESYRNALPLHGVGVEEDRSSLENGGSSRPPYDILTIEDVSPIETAKARFLQIIVDHFISQNVIPVIDSAEADFGNQPSQDKLNKRKPREVQYEGDPSFVLPLMYVANLYETLVNEVNIRLASLEGIRDKTIGVALEAAGGLYRRLAKKFPKKGPCIFKRRELATSLETRTRFPELVIQEEKRVRFVVVNGLLIVEKPNNMTIDDSEWFKRLTGRHEAAVTARDYKFYSPRHKYRRVPSHSVSSIPGLPFKGNRLKEVLGHKISSNLHLNITCKLSRITLSFTLCSKLIINQYIKVNMHHPIPTHLISVHTLHTCQRYLIISHQLFLRTWLACSPLLEAMSEATLQTLVVQSPTSLAKFCDECGAPYLRETSKFCSECGVKRSPRKRKSMASFTTPSLANSKTSLLPLAFSSSKALPKTPSVNFSLPNTPKRSSNFKVVRACASPPPKPSQKPLLQTLKSTSKTLILSAAVAAFIIGKSSKLPAIAESPAAASVAEEKLEESESGDSPLSQLLEKNPDAVDSLKSLLQQKIEAGEDSEALSILRRLVAAQPSQLDWKFLLGRLLNEMGEAAEARRVFEEILAVNPLSFEALFENALLMDRCGEGEAVIQRLEEALRIATLEEKEKEARDVRLIMAQIQFLQKRVEEALRSYQQLSEEDPQDFRPYFCQGVIYSLLDRNKEAREQFDKYHELSPKKFEVEGFLQTPLSRMKLFETQAEN